MKIFERLQKYLAILDIIPNELGRFNWKITMGFLVIALSTPFYVLIIFSIENTTLMDYVAFFCTISAVIETSLFWAVIVLKQMKFFDLIESIQNLINKRLEYVTSKPIYEDTNRLFEKISNILYVGCVKVLPQCIVWPKFVVSFVKYSTTDLNDDAFELPLAWWLPFNWHCPIGYLIAVVLQWTSFTYVCSSSVIVSIFGSGGYLFVMATIKDMKCILKSIDENSKTKTGRKQIYKQFTEFIDLHAATKQFFSNFSDTCQLIFMIVFLRDLLDLCCVLLIIQMELSNHRNHSTELLTVGFDACNTLVVVFISCELCQRLSNAFSEINDLIDQFQWYRFPIKMKQFLPMALTIAQKPVALECFGSFSFCREAFKIILKSVYSYFMVLREFIK